MHRNLRRAIRLIDFIVRRSAWFVRSRLGILYTTYTYHYKTNGIRYRTLRQYIKGKGFFVEAGANNGVTQSNTFLMEKKGRWTGLLVEPLPEKAKECRRNRAASIVENCALVSSDYPDETITLWDSNLMSLVKGYRHDEAEYLKRGRQFLKSDAQEITVPAASLSSLLSKYGITKVDFISLDVEGYELEVLKGIDFSIHAPDWFLIEYGDRPEILAFLDADYLRVVVNEKDTLFKKR